MPGLHNVVTPMLRRHNLPYDAFAFWKGKVMHMKMLAIIGLSLATAVSGVLPAQAFPSFSGPRIDASDVVQVRDRGRGYGNRHWRGGGDRWRNDGYRYGRRYGSYNGRYYRPSYGRYYRPNYGGYYRPYYGGGYYRGYDDFGAALGGFAAGAIIGGLAAQPRYYAPRYYGGNGHVSWCYSRYRSYRAYDNTFQPYYGPRRVCVSPY